MTFLKGVLLMLALILGMWFVGSLFIYQVVMAGLVNDWLSLFVYSSLVVPFIVPLVYGVFECASDMLSGGGEERK